MSLMSGDFDVNRLSTTIAAPAISRLSPNVSPSNRPVAVGRSVVLWGRTAMIRLRPSRATLAPLLLGSTVLATGCSAFNSANRYDQAKLDQAAGAELASQMKQAGERDRAGQTADASSAPAFTKRDPSGSSAVAENLRRGHREAEAGRPDAAARAYEQVLRDDPANASAHHRLGVIADERRDFAAAEQHYRAALRQWPGDADVLNDLGYSYIMRQNYAEGERTLREVLATAPKHQRALTNLGLLYVRVGDTDRALAVLRLTGSEAQAQTKLAMLQSDPAAPARPPAGRDSASRRP